MKYTIKSSLKLVNLLRGDFWNFSIPLTLLYLTFSLKKIDKIPKLEILRNFDIFKTDNSQKLYSQHYLSDFDVNI